MSGVVLTASRVAKSVAVSTPLRTGLSVVVMAELLLVVRIGLVVTEGVGPGSGRGLLPPALGHSAVAGDGQMTQRVEERAQQRGTVRSIDRKRESEVAGGSVDIRGGLRGQTSSAIRRAAFAAPSVST